MDEFKKGQFTWFTGIVEDVKDPLYLNRVKVRCIGYYDDSVAVKDLPWATVMMPTTTASVQGNGSNHHLEIGSWVVGFFRDGRSAQDPLVMGSIATQSKNEEEEDSNIPETGFLNSPTGNFVKDIPGEVGSSWDNKVYRSKAGHIIQLDNTENKEKIRNIGFILRMLSLGIAFCLLAYLIITILGSIYPDNQIFGNGYWYFMQLAIILVVLTVMLLFDQKTKIKLPFLLAIGQNTLTVYIVHVIVLYGAIFGIGIKTYLSKSLTFGESIIGAVFFILLFGCLTKLQSTLGVKIKRIFSRQNTSI